MPFELTARRAAAAIKHAQLIEYQGATHGLLITERERVSKDILAFLKAQAPPSGLAATFADPTYEKVFQPFSPGRLFSSIGSNVTVVSFFVPASPGDAGFSFLGITFKDARVASVRITAGDVAPGVDDVRPHDVVMTDDFIYGEPQLVR